MNREKEMQHKNKDNHPFIILFFSSLGKDRKERERETECNNETNKTEEMKKKFTGGQQKEKSRRCVMKR